MKKDVKLTSNVTINFNFQPILFLFFYLEIIEPDYH